MDLWVRITTAIATFLFCGCQIQTEIKIIIILVAINLLDWQLLFTLRACDPIRHRNMFQWESANISFSVTIETLIFLFSVSFPPIDSWMVNVSMVCFIELIPISMECRLFALNYNNKMAHVFWPSFAPIHAHLAIRTFVGMWVPLVSTFANHLRHSDPPSHTRTFHNKNNITKFKVWYFDDALFCYCEIMREIRNLSNHSNLKRKHARTYRSRALTHTYTHSSSVAETKTEDSQTHIRTHLTRLSSKSTKFKWLKSRDRRSYTTPSVSPPQATGTAKRKLTHPNETKILCDIWHTFKWHRQWCEREPKINTDLNKSQPNI